jgi:hypothetical protein
LRKGLRSARKSSDWFLIDIDARMMRSSAFLGAVTVLISTSTPLELKDVVGPIITLLSATVAALIVVIGWMQTARNNDLHHIFEIRLGKRLGMFDKVIPIIEAFADEGKDPFEKHPNLADDLRSAWVLVQLYGYQNEIDKFGELVRAINAHDEQRYNAAIPNLSVFVPRLRNELKYPSSQA